MLSLHAADNVNRDCERVVTASLMAALVVSTSYPDKSYIIQVAILVVKYCIDHRDTIHS